MATATSNSPVRSTIPTRRKLGLIGGALALFFLLWIAFNFADFKGQARLGTAYGAHVACSCRYIEGRSLESCHKDFEPGMGMVSLSDDPDHQRVTASVPFLAQAVAERRGKFGCIQLNAKEIEAID